MTDWRANEYSNLKIHYRYSEAKILDDNENISTGFIDASLIENLVSNHDADYYFCGPKPFMMNIYHELMTWGIPATQVNFEFFGPLQELQQ